MPSMIRIGGSFAMILAFVIGGPLSIWAQSRDTSLPAVSIKSGEAQLFVDDYLIASQHGLKRTLRQPRKDNGGNEPVIAIDQEFGKTKSTLEANGTIVFDPRLKKWVMFTLAFASSWEGTSADRVRLYRFTSTDGFHWAKGDDGSPQRIEVDLHDSKSNTSATNVDLFSCTYDETDQAHPYKGWLFFANWGPGREGTYYMQSADGIRWQRGPEVLVAGSRTIEQDGRMMNGTGDVTTFYHDRNENRFLACLRWASVTDVENTNRLRVRGFLFTDRLDRPIDLAQVDRLSLIPEGAMRNGDMPTDEYYSSTAWRYGSIWLGGLRIWHRKEDYPYSASGCAFLKLVVSRDGLNWRKVPFQKVAGEPEVFIPNGKEGGNDARNDGGYMTEFSNVPLRFGDELIYYYGSSSWGKNHPRPYRVSGGGIFRARLRPDGFVSVDAGSLVTRKLKCDGHELSVNGVGPIQVDVVSTAEPDAKVLATATVRGDSFRHNVRFEEGRSLRELAAKGNVHLKFTIGEGGSLYSFTVEGNQAQSLKSSPTKPGDSGLLTPVSFNPASGDETKNAPSSAAAQPEVSVKRLAIRIDPKSSDAVKHAARILSERIRKRSDIAIETVTTNDPQAARFIAQCDLVVAIGTPDTCSLTRDWMQQLGTSLPTLPNSSKIHPESLAVKSGQIDGKRHLVIAASEARSAIFGIGAVLRAITCQPDCVTVPPIDLQEKPAFWMRGGQPRGPGSRDRQYGKLRPRTADENQEQLEDTMLLGTNIFEEADVVRPYGMMTRFGRTANEMPAGFPKEWGADGGRSTKFVCPSVPEARKALIESFDKMFRDAPDHDFFSTNSGDIGGCRCDKCMPWGGKYIELVHEYAKSLHRYHPNTKILATNQDLTNEGNQQVFDYLNGQDSSWLFAIRYGPGADEMQTYIRGPVNPARFEYEGFGSAGNYLKYMHHVLPKETKVALYTDITHWMQAQFAVPKPDIALAAVYDRRSWNARPRALHKAAQEILHYAIGDIHYSEGIHDDFNKWVWYRLLWNPHLTAEALTNEYCRYWFGPDAQDEVAQAIFLMEETLERPVLGNAGIPKAVELLESAGRKIPENILRSDFRWRVIDQKALTDRYIQLLLERGEDLRTTAIPVLRRAESSKAPSSELNEAIQILDQPLVTEEMKRIMDRARQLGEESNTIAGYRIGAMFVTESLDLTEVGWWKETLKEALATGQSARMTNAAKMILRYEDPGKGGFYNDLGWPNDSARLMHGEALWGFRPFPGPARHSHFNVAYSLFDPQGLKLKYEGLDPSAQYVVRVAAGTRTPSGEGSAMLRGIEVKERVVADGKVVNDGFVVPRGSVTYQEFDLPMDVTSDAKVEISLVGTSKTFPIALAYDIWLLRKDSMPWTARP